MATFTIWEGQESGITLKLGREKPDHPGDHDAVKVLEYEAANWVEATQRRNDHYGWGPYEPFDDSESEEIPDRDG